ncbi:DUF1839 family protein [Cupriavidus pinatubonensis]|uniref:DUF1839 family protein n=1 Tax=Cupriavidus pinatubonensis TaxID=248026 RepID=UPI0011295970|nr:DUF1839 family protein [Cupriavidus pinatubonensis]QYY27680.1 DUF1839 family protein [Cupriavidus pinatubonensis]TPQ38991.1 DUF1839 domain-containing protein [Cupriavidus pinatubonensis]
MYGDTKMRGRGGPGLRGGNPVWSHVNSHVDLWIELLHGLDLPPVAALPCTVRQAFEADHFTQCRIPDADLERLFGLSIHALTLYDSLESHVAAQTCRGNIVVMEVDSTQLPPAPGAAYQRQRTLSCIGIDVMIPDALAVGYFHSDGYHTASGEDYTALFGRAPGGRIPEVQLYAHADVVRRNPCTHSEASLLQASLELFRFHLANRPRDNPVSTFRAAFPEHLDRLMARGEPGFHHYAAGVLRQLGANFELLARYLRWLVMQGEQVPDKTAEACYTMASEAMVMQFRLMRAVISRKPDTCEDCLDQLEASYQACVPVLARHFGGSTA